MALTLRSLDPSLLLFICIDGSAHRPIVSDGFLLRVQFLMFYGSTADKVAIFFMVADIVGTLIRNQRREAFFENVWNISSENQNELSN